MLKELYIGILYRRNFFLYRLGIFLCGVSLIDYLFFIIFYELIFFCMLFFCMFLVEIEGERIKFFKFFY